ncbi:MAG: DUF2318 domain-containing protein [Candidatus Aenigmarchaeota archaeon]|nr:DUF2318 domain-containing protein [Candidatus Aenigmarchaeota archaeon]
MMKKILYLISILTITLLVSGCTDNSASVTGDALIRDNDDLKSDSIKIPLAGITFDINKFEYDADGTEVKYFIMKGADGQIHTAFDACDVCGGKLGYTQRGNDVVCKSCGRVFRIDDLGTKNIGGGCWPGYLAHTIDGDNIIIKISELNDGAFRFR